MRSNFREWLAAILILAGCSGADERRPCAGVVCDAPPDDYCRDSSTLMDYPSTGAGNPSTGSCEYTAVVEPCDHGCAQGRCLEADRCQGVICDRPPPNACRDESTLVVYQPDGTCDTATGGCAYPSSAITCENGCQDGTCQDQSLCQGVVCATPPQDRCLDENTLLHHESEGRCDEDTGRCLYPASEQPCPHGCLERWCRPDPARCFELLVDDLIPFCGPGASVGEFSPPVKARAWPNGGIFCLETTAGEFPLELIETLELGPDGHLADPVGPGIVRQTENTPTWHAYEYSRPFQNGPQQMGVLGWIYVVVQGTDTFVSFNNLRVATVDTTWGLTYGYRKEGDLKTAFCTQNGDRFDSEGWVMGGGTPTWSDLTGTTIRRGAEQRVVEDYFDLFRYCGHHCDTFRDVIVLDEPLGVIRVLQIDWNDCMQPAAVQVEYLDQDMQVIESSPATTCEP